MSAKYRKPGPQAVIHRAHRRAMGPRTIVPHRITVPQYQTGPRHGQQVASIRRAVSLFSGGAS